MTLPTPFEFIVCALAVFRLSLLVSKEKGPAWIFLRLRREVPKSSSVKDGINCQWCVAVWAAIPIAVFLTLKQIGPDLPEWLVVFGDWFLLMLALSAGGIIVNQQWTKG